MPVKGADPKVVVNTMGTSMVGLLGVILVVLKLLGKIDISWWLVLAPFWLPAAIIILILLVVLAVAGILDWSDNKGRK